MISDVKGSKLKAPTIANEPEKAKLRKLYFIHSPLSLVVWPCLCLSGKSRNENHNVSKNEKNTSVPGTISPVISL